MNATVYLESADGHTQVLQTSVPGWRSSLDAQGDWTASDFDDASWATPVPYLPRQRSLWRHGYATGCCSTPAIPLGANMVRHGATTMWEHWNGDQMISDPSMNSFNHYAYGSVGEWMYRYAAGVDATPSDPGFHTVVMHPDFDARLGSVDFSYQSRYGVIRSQWTAKGDGVEWRITIPANARVRMEITSGDRQRYILDGKPLAESPFAQRLGADGDACAYQIPAGSFSLTVRPCNAAGNKHTLSLHYTGKRAQSQ